MYHSNLNSMSIMKMRFNIFYGIIVLLGTSVSCSDDFLEEKTNYGQYDDTFYQSEERVDWYLNNIYYDYFQGYTSPLSNLVGNYTSDYSRMTQEIGGMTDLINPTRNLIDAEDASGYYGTKLENKIKNETYGSIRDCNSLLEEIGVKGAELDEEYRNQAKGQAYYLRAIQYFDLMRVYGGVPIVTEIQEPSLEDESIRLPRASV